MSRLYKSGVTRVMQPVPSKVCSVDTKYQIASLYVSVSAGRDVLHDHDTKGVITPTLLDQGGAAIMFLGAVWGADFSGMYLNCSSKKRHT